MGRIIKAAAAVLIFAVLFDIFPIPSQATVNIPERIRIGLYYNDSSEHINTALSSFTFQAEQGLSSGVYINGDYMSAFQSTSSNPVTIRKDAYYAESDGKTVSYNPGDSSIPQGEKIGPYHIKLGNSSENEEAAAEQVKEYTSSGISAYCAFDSEWQVWTGFYTDEASAEREMQELLQKIDGAQAEIIPPSTDRIAVLDSSGQPRFVFGGTSGVFRVQPLKANSPDIFKINGKPYRGELEVRRFSKSDMTVINILPLEEYLYGVVAPEIGAGAPAEALKAQAVAARTYAVNNLRTHGSLDFDLCYTTYSQVYKGYSAEVASSNKAVDDTKGKLLLYQDKPAEVYYFASSGGWTEDASNVWKTSVPYLKSVEDKYESGKSWKYNWSVTYSADKIKSVMLSRKYDLGDILSVRITQTSPVGRATQLVITGTKDSRTYEKGYTRSVFSDFYSQWYSITTDADLYARSSDGKNIKTQLGAKKVASAGGVKSIGSVGKAITVIGAGSVKKTYPSAPENYTFTGKGNGHAVGLSQEGAIGMAKAGFTYNEILTHYFTGTHVK